MTTIQTIGKKRKANEMDHSDSEGGGSESIEADVASTTLERVEVVPGADVTLKVGQGDDILEIMVSGATLGLASKVFAT